MLTVLRSIDSQLRPLFAILLAEAVGQQGENPQRNWNKEQLLHYVIERTYEKYWQPGGISLADMLALVLATLCDGLKNPSQEVLQKINNMAEASGAERVSLNRLHALGLTKKEGGHTVIKPLQPDIIGELFVWETDMPVLREMNGMQQKMLPLAWELAPWDTALFFDRCSNDFLYHSNFYSWFRTCSVKNSPGVDELRAKAAFHLIAIYGNAGELEQAQGLYKDICALGTTPIVDEQRAMAVVYLTTFYGNAKNLEQAREFYDGICCLHSTSAVDELRTMAAVNLILFYRYAGELEQARGLYKDICSLDSTPTIDKLCALAKRFLNNFLKG